MRKTSHTIKLIEGQFLGVKGRGIRRKPLIKQIAEVVAVRNCIWRILQDFNHRSEDRGTKKVRR